MYSVYYIILCITLIFACTIFADWSYNNITSHIIKCVIDNFAHALIASLIWTVGCPPLCSFSCEPRRVDIRLVYRFLDCRRQPMHIREIVIAFIIGSFVDLDHFISAKSFYLGNATSLKSRPFGHSLIFIFVCMVNNIYNHIRIVFIYTCM
jgi:hypothetical protein